MESIQRAFNEKRYSDALQLIDNTDLNTIKLEVSLNAPTEVMQALVDKKIELDFDGDLECEKWEEIINVANNLKITGQMIELHNKYATGALKSYLDLVNIPYAQDPHGYELISLSELTEITDAGLYKDLFKIFISKNMFCHLKVILEMGYVPEYEEFKPANRIKAIDRSNSDPIILTLPLPWTDQLRYQWMKEFLERMERFRLWYYYFIYYDSAYQPTWEAIGRYIETHPDHQLDEDSVKFIKEGIIPDSTNPRQLMSVTEGYENMACDDGYLITNYNYLTCRDIDEGSKWKYFNKLIRQDHDLSRCWDPRFLQYYERLILPEYKEKLETSLKYNLSIEDYLIHIGLLKKDHHLDQLIATDNLLSNYRLLGLVKDGLVTANQLGANHPLSSVIKSKTTKRAR